jgi:hypothetical protein
MTLSHIARAGVCTALVLLATACAPSSYAVRNPAPSGQLVAGQLPANKLGLVDNRATGDKVFFSGILPATLTVDGAPVDAVKYLQRNLQAELQSRGVSAEVLEDAATMPRLSLRTFHIRNHRSNGYAPFISFTLISADLETDTGTQRLGVFVKRGKVPVWSFDEVIEPTLNQPLSIAMKELAAKITDRLYAGKSDDAEVARLVAKVATRTDLSYLDVYALGFTNNPKAIDALVPLTRDPDEYVRIAAISSLGTLRAGGQLDVLKAIYNSDGIWQDRAMALKSIGDIGSDDARAFLAEQVEKMQKEKSGKEAAWTLQVIGLYQ